MTHSRCRIAALAFLAFLLAPYAAEAQIFEDLTEFAGIQGESGSALGSGCTVVDFDQDGDDDIIIAIAEGDSHVFRNNGNLTFTEVDLALDIPQAKMMGFADYDGDGDLDIFISQYNIPNKLYARQDDGSYVDVTAFAGIIEQDDPTTGHTWGDVNNDGWIDLYVCNYSGSDVIETANHLYVNNGDATFDEIGVASGTDDGVKASLQASFYDYDGDGDQDIFVANDRPFDPNALFQNNGNLNFTNVNFAKNMGDYIDAMSSTIADYDNDGDLDVFISAGFEGNMLKKWVGFTYVDSSIPAGVVLYEYCWGAQFMDYDNDGRKDLIINSAYNTQNNSYGHNHLMRNVSDGFFELQEDEIQETLESDSYGNAFGDFDGDGNLDYITNSHPPFGTQVWHNTLNAGNWIKVNLEGADGNTKGLGAKIEVWAGDQYACEVVDCGGSYLSQNTYTKHIGLGDNTMADEVKVTWLSGAIDVFSDLEGDTKYTFSEGSGAIPVITSDGSLSFCEGDNVQLFCEGFDDCTWSTGEMTGSITVFEAGEYTVSALNAFGQEQTSEPVVVEILESGDWNILFTPPSCFPDTLGVFQVLGSDSLDVTLLEPENPTQLPPGENDWLISDISGCLVSGSSSHEAPAAIDLSGIAISPSCPGEEDGELVIEATGGSGPLLVETDCDPEEVSAGDCTVTVTDSLGCSITQTFTILDPEALNLTIDITGIDEGGTGTLSADMNGGTPPYTYEWSTGDSEEDTEVLEPGLITLTVTDANGCVITEDLLITDIALQELEGIQVWPNPVDQVLSIALQQNLTVEIYDMRGRLMQSEPLNAGTHQIDLGHLSPGQYLLSIPETSQRFNFSKR